MPLCPICAAKVDSGRESLLAAGLPRLMFLSARALHSPGIDVEICWRQRVPRAA